MVFNDDVVIAKEIIAKKIDIRNQDSTADSILHFYTPDSSEEWSMGVDNSDAKFSINQGSTLVSTAAAISISTGSDVGVGGQNVTSAKLAVSSTTKGFLPPRMTTTQRDAIATPAAGLVIYNSTTNKLNVYTTAWEAVTSA